MSIQNLFLSQQMRQTQENLDRVEEQEAKRRKRAGGWASGLGTLGGVAGGLLGLALAPATAGASIAALATGLGAAGGSLLGSRAGLEIGDGRQSDATPIGMNTSAISGQQKEFSSDIKSRYKRGVNDFQTQLNNAIASNAINTGIKAATMAYTNPTAAQGLRMDMRSGASRLFGGGGSGPVIPQVNLAGAQAYNPTGPQPNNMLNIADNPAQQIVTNANTNAPVLANPAFSDTGSQIGEFTNDQIGSNLKQAFDTNVQGNISNLNLPSYIGDNINNTQGYTSTYDISDIYSNFQTDLNQNPMQIIIDRSTNGLNTPLIGAARQAAAQLNRGGAAGVGGSQPFISFE